ncbi:MAG: ATP-binding cassette domain-containing protein [Lachnospiraceae bacterium]|jgi:ABC-type sugar transport system ATPase subunit
MKRELLRLESINCKGILRDFRMNIYEGEVLVLSGLIDSGLTSVGDFLDGSIKAQSGQVWFEEVPISLDWFEEKNANTIFRFRENCSLVRNMTVAENIFVLHSLKRPGNIVDTKTIRKKAAMVLKDLDVNITPDTMVAMLNPEDLRIIELIKAVSLGAKLIVLEDAWGDYPLWARDSLFGKIKMLKNRGIAFLIITQKHENLANIMDRIILMKSGSNIMTMYRSEYLSNEIHRILIGSDFYLPSEPLGQGIIHLPYTREIFRVENLSSKNIKSMSFSAEAGKVLGIYDISENAGRDFVDILIHGLAFKGKITLSGVDFTTSGRQETMHLSVGVIGGRDGNILQDNLTWPKNLALMYKKRNLTRNPLVSRRLLRTLAEEYEGEMDGLDPKKPLKDTGINDYLRLKLTYLKWILFKPKVLLCVKPCAFGDVLMREVAASMIRQAAARGICVMVISNDPKEVGSFCDQIAVLQNGALINIIERKDFIAAK